MGHGVGWTTGSSSTHQLWVNIVFSALCPCQIIIWLIELRAGRTLTTKLNKMFRIFFSISYSLSAVFFIGTLLSSPVYYLCLYSLSMFRVCLMFALFVRVYGFKGFPLWCMTWPRPHLEQSLAITTEEHHSSMPLVSPQGYNVWEWQSGLRI